MEPRHARAPGYGAVAKVLHWTIVLLIVTQFVLGLAMPHVGRGAQPVGLIGLHVSFGALILAVAVLRLIWRLTHPVPLETDNVPAWQVRAAGATHALLYALLLIVPLLGWIYGATRGWTPMLFGIIPLPQIVATGSPIGRALGEYHNLSAWVLLGAIGLHVLATAYHHFFLRDRVLERMLPAG